LTAFPAACTASTEPADSTSLSAAASQLPAAIPRDDAEAIRRSVELLNAAAGGAVSEQQEVLRDLVDPALGAGLDECPIATTTLLFEPVYPGLRPTPDWTSANGSLTGTLYALPSLIRIHTGDRVTGTDLTTLHFGVQSGEAFLTPLCVS